MPLEAPVITAVSREVVISLQVRRRRVIACNAAEVSSTTDSGRLEYWDRHLALEGGLAYCELFLLRPAALPRTTPPPPVGADQAVTEHAAALRVPLEVVGAPVSSAGRSSTEFLTDARHAIRDGLLRLIDENGSPRAAILSAAGREKTLGYVRKEFEDLVAVADQWYDICELARTGILTTNALDLLKAGFQIRLRSLSAFLTGQPTRKDEFSAACFLPAGAWLTARDADRCQRLAGGADREALTQGQWAFHKVVNKQVAHLSLSRPDLEDLHLVRWDLPLTALYDVTELLRQWTRVVDHRVLPEGWTLWIEQLDT